jgi:2'-5' RNA ligase
LRRALRATRGESAIVVPVPPAEPLVDPVRERHDPSAAAGMPAHVTLLYPFLPPGRIDERVEAALADALAPFPSFAFSLARIGRFPGVLYLEPEPPEPFVELVEALHARWPECPPFEGRFDAIVPHLTVAIGAEPAGLDQSLSAGLPIGARAEEILLMTQRARAGWTPTARFELR